METAYRMQTEAPEVFDIRKETRGDAEALRPRQHGARLPDGGPARPNAACAWCRSTTPRAIRGTPTTISRQHRKNAQGLRPAVRRRDQGPQITRPARRHARGLRFRVRPHAGDGSRRAAPADRRTAAITTRSASRCGWPAAASKAGLIYGATDEFGFKAVEKPVHVHDLHATILHLLGIDHTKLTYRYSGRDFRLTDVSGNVIHDIIA